MLSLRPIIRWKQRENTDNLVNAYDNSIRYTDDFLSRLIRMLEKQQVDAAMLYTSDHGEDIFDDSVICSSTLLPYLLIISFMCHS